MAHGHITIYVDGQAVTYADVETVAETRITNARGVKHLPLVYELMEEAIDDDRDHVWIGGMVYSWYIEDVD